VWQLADVGEVREVGRGEGGEVAEEGWVLEEDRVLVQGFGGREEGEGSAGGGEGEEFGEV